MIDWIGEGFGGGSVSVDPDDMNVTIDGEVNKADVCNAIPTMKTGCIVEIAGVTAGNWAPVIAVGMSTKADPDVFVLGDASQHCETLKSSFSANSHAKVCANAVCGALTCLTSKVLQHVLVADRYKDGVRVGASYEATEEKISKVDGFISTTGETSDLRKAICVESEDRHAGIMNDMFS